MAIITISRGSKSGGCDLAELVAGQLGCKVISREMLIEMAKDWGFDPKFWSDLSAKRMPRLWRKTTAQHRQYIHMIRSTLLEHAEEGSLVYHGNAGQFLLDHVPCVLRVKLIAPVEYRIKSAMEEHHLSRRDSIDWLKSVDENRARWIKFLYGSDGSDPTLYDLIINISRMKLETAAGLICATVEEDPFKLDDHSRDMIEDLVVQARVYAELSSSPRTSTLHIKVEVKDGVVQLTGNVETERVRHVVRDLVRGVKGVNSIHGDLQVKRLSPLPTQGGL